MLESNIQQVTCKFEIIGKLLIMYINVQFIFIDGYIFIPHFTSESFAALRTKEKLS